MLSGTGRSPAGRQGLKQAGAALHECGNRQQYIEVKNYLRCNGNHVNGSGNAHQLFARREGESGKSGEDKGFGLDQISKDWRLKGNKQRADAEVDVIWMLTRAKPSRLPRSTLTGSSFTVIVLS